MKHIDDQKIIDSLSGVENYEIKTTADDILAAFEKEKAKEPLIEKKKKFNFNLFFKISIPALAACSIALIVVFSIPKDGGDIIIPPNPSNNQSILNLDEEQQNIIGKELNTLASFQADLNAVSTSSLPAFNNGISTLDNDDWDDNDYQSFDIDSVIDLYDPYSHAVINLINNKEFNLSNTSIENGDFGNILTLTSGQEVLKVEYNIAIETGRNDFLMEGMLTTNTGSYPITIFTEKEGNETEVETIIEYSSTNVVKIEQENEPGKWESENSISYATYKSKDEAYHDDLFLEKFTYEYENELDDSQREIEMGVEIEKNSSFFDQESLSLEVLHHDLKNVYFEFEYELEYPEIEIEDEWISCTINDDGSRLYEYRGDSQTRN